MGESLRNISENLSSGQSSLQEKEVLLTCISSNTAVAANISYDLRIITGSVKRWTWMLDRYACNWDERKKSEVTSCKGIL